MDDKTILRKRLLKARREHAAALPDAMRGLVFRHPPAALLERIPQGAMIGLYRASAGEAPTAAYSGYFLEQGHPIALPRVTSLSAPMTFHLHSDPFGESDLVSGPMGLKQPGEDAVRVTPEVLIVPLVGFTDRGDRLGQGGGFYDRWLAEHPDTITIGLAWDVQLCEELPVEPHDVPLDAVVTPTRLYGPF